MVETIGYQGANECYLLGKKMLNLPKANVSSPARFFQCFGKLLKKNNVTDIFE